jgi:hypothetical protein
MSRYAYNSEGLEDALFDFLEAHPGSLRREIDTAMSNLGYERYATDKILKRVKKLGLLRREGNTVQARWYAT